jgi:hypothetical protein
MVATQSGMAQWARAGSRAKANSRKKSDLQRSSSLLSAVERDTQTWTVVAEVRIHRAEEMTMSTKIDQALADLAEQVQWIAEHGRDRAGYVARYGAKNDPYRYGDGGDAIYDADVAEYNKRRDRWLRAVENSKHKL